MYIHFSLYYDLDSISKDEWMLKKLNLIIFICMCVLCYRNKKITVITIAELNIFPNYSTL